MEEPTAPTVFISFRSLKSLRMSLSSKSNHAHRDTPANSYRIVAVHGLGAHPEYTWTSAPSRSTNSEDDNRIHLLRDLLKKDFPTARILAFAHNSDWLINAPIKSAQQIADRLLKELAKHRSEHLVRTTNSEDNTADRGHSAFRSSSSAIALGASS